MDATTAAYSELVGLIYEAAMDRTRWSDALEMLRTQLRFATATVSLVALPEGRLLLFGTSGIPEPWLQRINEYDADVIDLWGGAEVARAFPLDRAAVVSRVNPAAICADSRNRYVREWGDPQGLVDSMALILARDSSAIGTLAMGRHRDAGPITERETAYAELLLPHMQRAAAISRMLDARTAAADAFASVIDGLATPIFVVDSRRRVLHSNEAARELLSAETGLSVRANVLSSSNSAVARSLTRAVEACITSSQRGYAEVQAGASSIPVRNPAGAYALHVLPMRRTARQPDEQGAVAAVLATRPGAPARNSDMAAALFGLTPAETRVFEHISSGRTRRETADALDIAPSTVQTHLLRVFAKVGAKRQADLVQVAASLASPVVPAVTPREKPPFPPTSP